MSRARRLVRATLDIQKQRDVVEGHERPGGDELDTLSVKDLIVYGKAIEAAGHGRSGRDRLRHWRIAYGSAKEVDRHLRLLAHAGAINRNRADSALRNFDEVRAITWRLLHPKA